MPNLILGVKNPLFTMVPSLQKLGTVPIFIFGLSIGSFLNCLIYRLRTGQSFLKGWSFCPHCKHRLGFFDLIPVLSFIFLKGKCRYCQQKISWQYPLVELASGGLFVLILWQLSFGWQPGLRSPVLIGLDLVYLLVISCFLVVIFVYDLKHYLIPDKVIYPAVAIALGFNLVNSFVLNHQPFLNPLAAAFGASFFFFLLWLVSRGKWMGLGDAKLAFFMGIFLAFPNILVAVFFAFLIGAIMGVGLIALGKKTLKSQVPFGPFLVAGTFIALFFGDRIINWYVNLLI